MGRPARSLAALAICAFASLALSQFAIAQQTVANPPANVTQAMQNGSNLQQLLQTPQIVAALARGELPEEIERERTRLQELLVSLGYLGADVSLEIVPAIDNSPASVKVLTDTGPLYRIATVNFDLGYANAATLIDQLDDVAAGAINQVATGELLRDLQDRALWQLGETGHAFAVVDGVSWQLNRGEAMADFTLRIDTGMPVTLANTVMERVAPALMDRVVRQDPFVQGQLYSSRKFDEFRQALAGLPNTRRTRLEAVDLGDGTFQLVVEARVRGATSFDPKSTTMGLAVLSLTLLVILVSLVFSTIRPNRATPVLVNVAIGLLALSSVTLIATRAASLI